MSAPQLPPVSMFAQVIRELRTSASQIESYRLCKRKWGFDQIDGIPRAQTPAAALGDRVHKLREDYLNFGIWPSRTTWEGQLALIGLEHLPPPRLPLVELRFDFGLGPNIRFRGRIDFLVPNGRYDGNRIWGTPGIPLVGDHKTTSRTLFIKTPEKLTREDPQAAIYGAYALAVSGANEVDLHWSYMVKTTPRPGQKQVRVRMSRMQVEDSFTRAVNDAQEMLTLVNIHGIRAAQLEPNVRACEAFGGCPYKSVCPLTDQQRFGGLMMNNDPASFPQNNGAASNGNAPGMNLNMALAPVPPGAGAQQGLVQSQDGSWWSKDASGAWVPYNNSNPPQQFVQAPAQQFAPAPAQQQFAQAPAPQAQQQFAQAPQAQQQFAPTAQQGTGQIFETPAEILLAAQLVYSQQPLQNNATPGLVKAYSGFIQQPALALAYLQANSAHQQTQQVPGNTAPSTGVNPPDKAAANTQSTEDTMKAADKAAKAAAKAEKEALKAKLNQTQATDATSALLRIANALEDLAKYAQFASGMPQAQPHLQPTLQQQFAQQQPPQQQQFQSAPTFVQQPTFAPNNGQQQQAFVPNIQQPFVPNGQG